MRPKDTKRILNKVHFGRGSIGWDQGLSPEVIWIKHYWVN